MIKFENLRESFPPTPPLLPFFLYQQMGIIALLLSLLPKSVSGLEEECGICEVNMKGQYAMCNL
jgi:hypothetical protein